MIRSRASPCIAAGGLLLFYLCWMYYPSSDVAAPPHGVQAPQRKYLRREPIDFEPRNMTSKTTQDPLDYFMVPVCRKLKPGKIKPKPGEIYDSFATWETLYQAQVRYNEWCKIACRWELIQKDFEAWKIALDGEYQSILYLHEVPIVTVAEGGTTEKGPFKKGFSLGWKEDDKYFINNHLFLTIEFYHDRVTDLHSIVGVFAKPVSVKHTYNGEWTGIKPRVKTCVAADKLFPNEKSTPQPAKFQEEVIFTYNVDFKEVDRPHLPKGYPK